MKIVLLTTDTTHHTYYAGKLSEQFPLQAIIIETRRLTPPFETFHPFESLRDEYEQKVLLGTSNSKLENLARTLTFDSVNDEGCLKAIISLAPQILIVFGTGRLLPSIISLPTLACLNLHGGNPEQYRGLDTHLWAIYHRDFQNLVTTLHKVDEGVDTGDIVFETRLTLTKTSKLHELRAINTEVCVKMSLLALSALSSNGFLPCRKQIGRGRYYSSMPSVLKEDCLRKFDHHVARL
ncbi:MAG TPA: formyltransferase family protein [Pyrinomonadaceae bacterium]|nr:formyltransferase family protein [Pyrinomonadaceae bacterium]